MSKITKMFFDLETTGVDVRKNGIHQISGLIEVDGIIKEEFDWRVKPNPKAKIEPEALAVSSTTMEDLETFPDMKTVYFKMLRMLEKYVDRFDRRDKIHLVGYNNRQFDDNFLRAWFKQNDDPFFGSWFWSDSLDVIVLASQFLMEKRRGMSNFKLRTVAKKLGLEVDDSKLHDAKYDILLTRDMYRIITGLEMDLM